MHMPISHVLVILAVLDSQDPIVSYTFLKLVSERSQLVQCSCVNAVPRPQSRIRDVVEQLPCAQTVALEMLQQYAGALTVPDLQHYQR